MIVRHVLKNGTELESMSGYVVQRQACPELYALVERMEDDGFSEHSS